MGINVRSVKLNWKEGKKKKPGSEDNNSVGTRRGLQGNPEPNKKKKTAKTAKEASVPAGKVGEETVSAYSRIFKQRDVLVGVPGKKGRDFNPLYQGRRDKGRRYAHRTKKNFPRKTFLAKGER